MKITKSYLKQIIKEEIDKLKESPTPEDISSERERLSNIFRNHQAQVKSETGFIAGGVKTRLGAVVVSLTPTHDRARELNIPVKEYIVSFHGERPTVMYKKDNWEVQYSGGGEQEIISAAKRIRDLDSKLDKTSKY